MADVTDLIAYYVNLLIIQYNNQPKAQATISLFAQEMLASGIIFDVQDAYNLVPGKDTIINWDEGGTWDDPALSWDNGDNGIAIGTQLDVIGKYVGVDRFYSAIVLENYFSLVEYDEVTPTSPPRFGFETYATFGQYNYNGTLTYANVVTINNALTDADFLVMIRLKIIQNNSNYSHQQIDDAIFQFFGTTIRPESNGNMQMVYFISIAISALVQAILFKKLLPKPMGVGLTIVQGVQGLMFGLASYGVPFSAFAYGFSTYANYASLNGQVLVYDQITQG